MKNALIGLIALLSITCTAQNITRYYDKFDDYIKIQLNRNKVSWIENVHMDAQAFISKGEVSYSLVVRYYDSDWIFIEDGQSLTIIADTTKLELKTHNGSRDERDVLSGGSIVETARYDITPEQYLLIASSFKTEFKLKGSRVFVTDKMTKKGKERMMKFYDLYMSDPEKTAAIKPEEIKAGVKEFVTIFLGVTLGLFLSIGLIASAI